MVLYVVLGQITVYNRVRGMRRQIKRLEWPRRSPLPDMPLRILVVFDSRTGNTRKVAEAVAESLQADLSPVGEAGDPRGYDLVVIGSPSMSSLPSPAMRRYLQEHPGLGDYAAFFTYGAPVWGPVSVRKALAWMEAMIGRAPLATFRCKGYHTRLRTYRGRPNEDDLLSAFLFGVRLVGIVGRRSWTQRESVTESCG